MLFHLKQNVPALINSMVDKVIYVPQQAVHVFRARKHLTELGILPKKIYLAMLPAVYCRIKPQQTVYGLHG
jgi:hypothetical protein